MHVGLVRAHVETGVRKACGLFGHCRHDARVAVPGVEHADARGEIDVAPAIDIPQLRVLGPDDIDTLGADTVRSQARSEAILLRRAISGGRDEVVGLAKAIQDIADFTTAGGMHVELALVDTSVEVSSDASSALLGALREALTNAAKHAGVQQVLVNLTSDELGVRLIVRDRGVGFDQSTDTKGFGLKNSIVARLAEVNGVATVESTPGQGTKITLWAPR